MTAVLVVAVVVVVEQKPAVLELLIKVALAVVE
jgi:hypothetical protein